MVKRRDEPEGEPDRGPRGRLLLAGAAGVVASGLLAGCGGGGGSGSGTAASVGCQPSGVPAYAGRRAGDCLAEPAHHYVVAVGGYEVLVGNWKRATDDAGDHLICAGVNVEGVAGSPVDVEPSQFRLLTPTGRTETARDDPSNGLAPARLSTGAQEGGSVCWPDPGSGGQYVAGFLPRPSDPSTGPRGVWLITFLPASG